MSTERLKLLGNKINKQVQALKKYFIVFNWCYFKNSERHFWGLFPCLIYQKILQGTSTNPVGVFLHSSLWLALIGEFKKCFGSVDFEILNLAVTVTFFKRDIKFACLSLFMVCFYSLFWNFLPSFKLWVWNLPPEELWYYSTRISRRNKLCKIKMKELKMRVELKVSRTWSTKYIHAYSIH